MDVLARLIWKLHLVSSAFHTSYYECTESQGWKNLSNNLISSVRLFLSVDGELHILSGHVI